MVGWIVVVGFVVVGFVVVGFVVVGLLFVFVCFVVSAVHFDSYLRGLSSMMLI